MSYQVLPLYNFPNNTYSIPIEINEKNITFNLFFSYNQEAQYWTIDILNDKNENIVCNIPLLTGQNLFQGLDYLEIGKLYIMRKSDMADEIPNSNNLDTDYWLIWEG